MLVALFFVSLHKKSCTRQFESKLSLRSFAFSLQKIIRTIHYLSGLNRTRDRIIQNPPLLREHALHIYIYISSKQNHNEYEMDSNHPA